MISTMQMQSNNIPFIRLIQEEGEMIVNFPGAYHAGFNLGFNCAESTNFGTSRYVPALLLSVPDSERPTAGRWVPYGMRAKPCSCARDSVRIDMYVVNLSGNV
jgi:jumonji domain-containing protein 2